MKYLISLCIVLVVYLPINISSNTPLDLSSSKNQQTTYAGGTENNSLAGILDEFLKFKITGEEKRKILQGTFIQPSSIVNWSEGDFDRHFKEYADLHFDHVILQWTEYVDPEGNKHIYYASSLSNRNLEKDLLGKMLRYGRKYGIKVYVGLNMDEQWWETYTKTPAQFDQWWKKKMGVSASMVDDIWSGYGEYAGTKGFSSFAGWYIPFEIDNLSFNTDERRDILCKQLSKLTNHIKNVSGLPVMMSPFYYRSAEIISGPKNWEDMWVYILSKVDIDIIALQDGIGRVREPSLMEDSDRSNAIKNAKRWFDSTRQAVNKSGKAVELWGNVETFTEQINNGSSVYKTAPLDRILKQIEVERPYVEKFTSFSFQAYQESDSSKRAMEEYKKYLESIR